MLPNVLRSGCCSKYTMRSQGKKNLSNWRCHPAPPAIAKHPPLPRAAKPTPCLYATPIWERGFALFSALKLSPQPAVTLSTAGEGPHQELHKTSPPPSTLRAVKNGENKTKHGCDQHEPRLPPRPYLCAPSALMTVERRRPSLAVTCVTYCGRPMSESSTDLERAALPGQSQREPGRWQQSPVVIAAPGPSAPGTCRDSSAMSARHPSACCRPPTPAPRHHGRHQDPSTEGFAQPLSPLMCHARPPGH